MTENDLIDPELREKSLRYSPKLTQEQREKMVSEYKSGNFSMKDLAKNYKISVASVRDSLIRYGLYIPVRRKPYNFNKNYGTKLNAQANEKKLEESKKSNEVVETKNEPKISEVESKKPALDNETDLKKEDFLPNNDEVENSDPFLCGRCYKSGIETEIKKGQEICHSCGAVLEWL